MNTPVACPHPICLFSEGVRNSRIPCRKPPFFGQGQFPLVYLGKVRLLLPSCTPNTSSSPVTPLPAS